MAHKFATKHPFIFCVRMRINQPILLVPVLSAQCYILQWHIIEQLMYLFKLKLFNSKACPSSLKFPLLITSSSMFGVSCMSHLQVASSGRVTRGQTFLASTIAKQQLSKMLAKALTLQSINHWIDSRVK